MKKIHKRRFLGALSLAVLAGPLAGFAADKTEDQLIAELASPNETKVTDALLQLEKKYPTSTKAFPTMKKLLKDPRAKVRRKAARVLGVLHADVDQENIKDICALLKASDTREIMDGLIALRGLKAQSAVPEIVPFLKHAHPNVIRDACRTLAVLGTKELIPEIEPLLKHSDAKVKLDAQDAIYKLRSKS
jgi:HEAT repeat protein